MLDSIMAFTLMTILTVLVWGGLLSNDIYGFHGDGRKHLLITASTAIGIGLIGIFTQNALWYFIGMGTALSIGVLKELLDNYIPTGWFDIGNLLADLAGACILAPFTIFTIAIFINIIQS